jgi:hypothetical protein
LRGYTAGRETQDGDEEWNEDRESQIPRTFFALRRQRSKHVCPDAEVAPWVTG